MNPAGREARQDPEVARLNLHQPQMRVEAAPRPGLIGFFAPPQFTFIRQQAEVVVWEA